MAPLRTTILALATLAGCAIERLPPPSTLTIDEAAAAIEALPPSRDKDEARKILADARTNYEAQSGNPTARRIAVFGADQAVDSAASEGRWTPNQLEAENAWDALSDYGQAKPILSSRAILIVPGLPTATVELPRRPLVLSAYRVQIAGVLARPGEMLPSGARPRAAIIIQGLCDGLAGSSLAAPDWRTRWSIINGGGDCRFVAAYDPTEKKIIFFNFGGR